MHFLNILIIHCVFVCVTMVCFLFVFCFVYMFNQLSICCLWCCVICCHCAWCLFQLLYELWWNQLKWVVFKFFNHLFCRHPGFKELVHLWCREHVDTFFHSHLSFLFVFQEVDALIYTWCVFWCLLAHWDFWSKWETPPSNPQKMYLYHFNPFLQSPKRCICIILTPSSNPPKDVFVSF